MAKALEILPSRDDDFAFALVSLRLSCPLSGSCSPGGGMYLDKIHQGEGFYEASAHLTKMLVCSRGLALFPLKNKLIFKNIQLF